MVRERYFARPRVQPAADQGRHARRVMRGAERPPVGERAAFDLAGDGGDHRHFQEFGRRERRQDEGAAPRASTCRRRAARP